MILLKLMAQAIARKRSGKPVTLADVRGAVSMLELQSNEQSKQVLKYLRMASPQRSSPPELIMQLVQDAISGVPLPWSRGVDRLLKECSGSPAFYKTPALLQGTRPDAVSDDELLAYAEQVSGDAVRIHAVPEQVPAPSCQLHARILLRSAKYQLD